MLHYIKYVGAVSLGRSPSLASPVTRLLYKFYLNQALFSGATAVAGAIAVSGRSYSCGRPPRGLTFPLKNVIDQHREVKDLKKVRVIVQYSLIFLVYNVCNLKNYQNFVDDTVILTFLTETTFAYFWKFIWTPLSCLDKVSEHFESQKAI